MKLWNDEKWKMKQQTKYTEQKYKNNVQLIKEISFTKDILFDTSADYGHTGIRILWHRSA